MLAETIIEISSLFVSAALLLIFVPKNKIREASVIFCFKQLITWLLGLFVAEFNLIEYPVRLFANATKASLHLNILYIPQSALFLIFTILKEKVCLKEYCITSFTLQQLLFLK